MHISYYFRALGHDRTFNGVFSMPNKGLIDGKIQGAIIPPYPEKKVSADSPFKGRISYLQRIDDRLEHRIELDFVELSNFSEQHFHFKKIDDLPKIAGDYIGTQEVFYYTCTNSVAGKYSMLPKTICNMKIRVKKQVRD